MIEPTCPSCQKQTFFTAVPSQVLGAGMVQLVCCEQCGCVVGVIDHQKSDSIDQNVTRIVNMVKQLLDHAGVAEQ